MSRAPGREVLAGRRDAVGWSRFEVEAPGLAVAVTARFAAHRHLTMATLRADGSPRISGTEAGIVSGRLWLGAMPESVKVRDLRRDPRVAIHSGSDDPPAWTGDAKVSGVAVEIVDATTKEAYLAAQPPGDADAAPQDPSAFVLFEVRLTDASTVTLGEPPDHIVVTAWRPGRGLTRTERR